LQVDSREVGYSRQVHVRLARGSRHQVGTPSAQDAVARALPVDDLFHRGHGDSIPASTRSGRIGRSSGPQPVALYTALPIDAATPMVEISPSPTPPPLTCSQPSEWKCMVISGVSPMPGGRSA